MTSTSFDFDPMPKYLSELPHSTIMLSGIGCTPPSLSYTPPLPSYSSLLWSLLSLLSSLEITGALHYGWN